MKFPAGDCRLGVLRMEMTVKTRFKTPYISLKPRSVMKMQTKTAVQMLLTRNKSFKKKLLEKEKQDLNASS